MGRHYNDWLQAYMEFTLDQESPANFHFWTGIATIAGALRRRVWIDMRKFAWTPNFYIILVAPAGIAAKSTSISIGMDLLSKTPTETGIHFGPESMTWQKLADSLSSATEYVKYIDFHLQENLQPMSALTCAVSELGTFLTLDDDKLISFLIRMWDGGDATFIHATKASGNVEVKAPWLNIIAATTPTWLAQNFPPIMIGGGLASRIIFVHGEKKRRLIPYPDEEVEEQKHKEWKEKLVADLTTIASLSGPYIILPEARIWGRQWYLSHNNGARPAHLASDRFSGYLARKQTHLHKVAMILAASKRDELYITRDDLSDANDLLTTLEAYMVKTFEVIGENEVARAIQNIKSILENTPSHMIRHDHLVRGIFRHTKSKVLEEALQTGIQMGMFRPGQDKDQTVTYNLVEKPDANR